MAEMFNSQVPMEMQPEAQAISRQQKMAELLMAKGMQPTPGQTVSGGVYVPTNPMEHIANLFNSYAGSKGLESAEQQQLQMAKAIRQIGGEEVKNILETAKTDPNAAMALASNAQTSQGKAFAPALMANVLPKKTDKLVEYDTYKAETPVDKQLKFNDWSKQITPEQQARLNIDRQRLGLEGARFGLEKQKLAQELQYGKPLNEAQAKAAVFHSQMVSASNELGNVYSKGFNPNSPAAQAQTSMAGGFLNAITPAEAQQAKQAQNQWTEAYLRFKTGAGTNAHEVEANRQTYFPQIGDKPDQIAQKSRMRAQAEQDIAMAAGPQGGRLGAQSIMPSTVATPSAKPESKNATPSLWGQATVVGK